MPKAWLERNRGQFNDKSVVKEK